MELGKKIVQHRKRMNLSQEELAGKIYVSRQSISNWENDKTYPDIHSLLLLTRVFNVSLDALIEGDLEMMKATIKKDDSKQFTTDAKWMTAGMFLIAMTGYPLFYFWDNLGIAIVFIEAVVTTYFAFRVEAFKKKYDRKTYRQLSAIVEGKTLDKIQEIEEKAKYPYQHPLIVLVTVGVFVAIMLLSILIIQFLFPN